MLQDLFDTFTCHSARALQGDSIKMRWVTWVRHHMGWDANNVHLVLTSNQREHQANHRLTVNHAHKVYTHKQLNMGINSNSFNDEVVNSPYPITPQNVRAC
jgi:hypothetical protein